MITTHKRKQLIQYRLFDSEGFLVGFERYCNFTGLGYVGSHEWQYSKDELTWNGVLIPHHYKEINFVEDFGHEVVDTN